MTGSIAPYFYALVPPAQPLPAKKKPKRHWWKTLVKIIAVGICLGVGAADMAIAALEVGAAAVGTQLVSMAAGVSSKFDARATNTMTTVLMNSALGNVVSHTPMNLENMAASAIGSMMVQEVQSIQMDSFV